MVGHLCRFFPEHCAAFGSRATLDTIRRGIRSAGELGIPIGPDCCRFIDLLFTFGEGFPSSFDWARQIVEDGSIDAGDRLRQLHSAALSQLQGLEAGAR